MIVGVGKKNQTKVVVSRKHKFLKLYRSGYVGFQESLVYSYVYNGTVNRHTGSSFFSRPNSGCTYLPSNRVLFDMALPGNLRGFRRRR